MKAKFLKFITLIISVIGVILLLRVIKTNGDESAVSMIINYTMLILLVTVAITILFSIFNLLKNPATLKKTLISLAIFGVIFAVNYMIAGDEAAYNGKKEVMLEAGSVSKLVEAGIKFSMTLGVISFLLIVFDSVKSLVKS
jgi:uncharacterized membrane protein